jgi:DNA-directed RNA polymerase specialized sigma24 family protein
VTDLAEAEAFIRSTARRLAPLARDADDLAQIGRLAAWQADLGFDGTGDRLAWMCAKARWAMIDTLRVTGPYSRTGRIRYALALDLIDHDIPDPAPTPEDLACDAETVAEFTAWLDTLPSRTAEAVVLTAADWGRRHHRHPSRASQVRTAALTARAA